MIRTLIVLRPEPGASRTAARARAMGLAVAVAPLFETVPLDWTPPDPARFDAVLMTSANAARFGGQGLARYTHLPLIAVGAATADAARAAGFVRAIAGEEDVAALAPALAHNGLVLHLAGREHRVAGANVEAVAVYAAEVLPAPALPESGVALIHSPRAAARLDEICADKSVFDIVAISAAAATAAGLGWRSIAAANRPTDAAMLALAARLCEGP